MEGSNCRFRKKAFLKRFSFRPYGTEGLCSTLTQGCAALPRGYFRFLPAGRKKPDSFFVGRRSRWTANSSKKRRRTAKTGYNLIMFLAILAMRVLEVMFFTGLVGSSVVVLISFAEDGKELFGKDEPPESRG